MARSPAAHLADEPSDIALFAAAQSGDYGAFETVVKRYHDRVYRLVLGMTKSPTDAEEVVQETFLGVFRGLAAFKGDSAPGSWIFRVAVNAALMRLRSHRRKPLLALADLGAQTTEPGNNAPFWAVGAWAKQPDDSLLSKELATRVDRAIAALPEKYRLVLLLRDLEDNSNDEVAQALGLTLPTVKSRLHRARLFVRQEIEAYFSRR